jgi:hypothetical protein
VIQTRNSVAPSVWSALDADLPRRVRKTSIILGAVVAIPLTTYFGLMAGAAWVAGVTWSLFNLAMTGSLMKRILTDARDRNAIALILTLKFPVLYAAGFVMLAVLRLPAVWWLAGFSWPLFVTVMKAAGRTYLGLDEATHNREGLKT